MIYHHSSSSASVMKLVLFNWKRERVAPETQLSVNMLCAFLIREGNSAARHQLHFVPESLGGDADKCVGASQ